MISKKWMMKYSLAKKYFEEHGNLLIQNNYEVTLDDGQIIKLGNWICNQRRSKKNIGTGKLCEEQIKLLDSIGMVWTDVKDELSDDVWQKYFLEAKKYFLEHGNLLVPTTYKVNDLGLGCWLNNQRQAYRGSKFININEERIKLLDSIGMVWDYIPSFDMKDKWVTKYNLAKAYYEKHGNLLIPISYEVKDDNGNIIRLGRWINIQRTLYKNKIYNLNGSKLSDKRIELLEEIGMVWTEISNLRLNETNNELWLKYYTLAKNYYKKYGNLLISNIYKVKSDEEKRGLRLGLWLKNQKLARINGCLTETQIKLLDDIKMNWNDYEKPYSDKWIKNYKIAKDYYEKHGNLLLPTCYIVKDENGKDFNLGSWLCVQRYAYKNRMIKDFRYKINETKINLLNSIDMIWDLREYKKYIRIIENNYNISNYVNNEKKNVVDSKVTFSDDEIIEKKENKKR